MSGELDERPDLTALLRNLRDRVYELEHRVSGDANPLALNDLEDVRVDSLGDATITLADGDALVYRASDELWVPGTGGSGDSIWKYLPSPGAEVLIDTTAAPDVEDFFVKVGTSSPWSYLEIWDQGSGVGDSFITLTTTGDLGLYADGEANLAAAGDLYLFAGGNTITSLPTADPSVSGALWNDSGTVKVSP